MWYAEYEEYDWYAEYDWYVQYDIGHFGIVHRISAVGVSSIAFSAYGVSSIVCDARIFQEYVSAESLDARISIFSASKIQPWRKISVETQ